VCASEPSPISSDTEKPEPAAVEILSWLLAYDPDPVIDLDD
jgi:hypothetical protein